MNIIKIINTENELAMAKRARLMTAEDVVDELELEDDYDNFDERMMPGSDEEFSDCDLEDEDEDVSDDEQTTLPPQLSKLALLHHHSLLIGPPT